MLPRYLRTADAAQLLGLSKSRLEKLRLTGGGPVFCKPSNGAVAYAIPDLIEWMERSKRQSTSDLPAEKTTT